MAEKEKLVPLEKSWDKEIYFNKLLNNRSRDFYIQKSKSYLNLSYIILIFSLIMVLFNGYVIHANTKEKSYYVTGIDGKVYQIKINDEKFNKMNRAIETYYANKRAQQNNKGN